MDYWLLSSSFFGLWFGVLASLHADLQFSPRLVMTLQWAFHLVFTRQVGKTWIEKEKRSKESWSETTGADTNNETFMGSEDLVELLPGIHDDITLESIISKFSWRDAVTLSRVSSSWKQAIQTRMVHDARVRSQSLETLAIVRYLIPNPLFPSRDCSYWISNLSLYSVRNKSWYDLPALPGRVRHGCQCIAFDGKFYVMGGGNLATTLDNLFYSRGGGYLEGSMRSKEVYVLDLAGLWQWRQCASMHAPRANFGAGLLNGKIYVFGGCLRGSGPEYGSEVYDPKDDVWSPIEFVFASRVSHQVAAVGNELFLYGGFNDDSDVEDMDLDAFDPVREDSDGEDMDDDEEDNYAYYSDSPTLLEAYDPIKNETRVIGPTLMTLQDKVFISKERFYRITDSSVDVYDFGGNLWITVRSFSKFPHETITTASSGLASVVTFDDEKLLVHCVDRNSSTNLGPHLLLSTLPGGNNEEISWETIGCPLRCAGYSYSPQMYPIQL